MKKMRSCRDLIDGLHDFCEYVPKEHRYSVVEIGTYVGESTRVFEMFFKHVYTIDPWDMDWIRDSTKDPTLTEHMIQSEYNQNVKGEKTWHIRQSSVLAAQRFESRSIDLVYIDGWHQLLPCVIDIMAWLPKIRLNGYIGGHDYHTDHSCVIPAVMMTVGKPDKIFKDTSWIKKIGVGSVET